MATRRARRIVSSWVALVAVLVITFAPSLTRMLGSGTAAAYGVICSASNLPSDTGAASDRRTREGHAVLEHCPYCSLQAHLALPPASRPADARIVALGRALPTAFLESPAASWVWSAAQPRAPPFFA
jgi:hypothetical protein